MKTLRSLSAVLAILGTCALHAAEPVTSTARTEVIFDNPDAFTDVKDSNLPSDKGRDAILARIRSFLVERAESRLPVGDTLAITFTDIDLAGEYEPWRGGQWSDVRIIKPIYPPAFKFTYSVKDPSGRVVKEGAEHIRDLNFDTRLVSFDNDSLRYEKDILDEWMRSALRDLRKP